MKARKNIFLMLVLSIVLALAACSGQSSAPKNEDKPSDSGESKEEGKKGGHLVFVTGADAPTLDPHGTNDTATTNATSQIFERLLEFDKDGKPAPALASEFTQVDELTWTFKLREGVKFHDGTDFNAEAVKINFERVLDPEFASPRAFVLNMIESITVDSEFALTIKTKFPFAPLPNHLSHNAGSIISPAAIQAEKDGGKKVSENPIGTGPFKLDTWNTGAEIKFAKNEEYWGEKASVDTMSFVVVPEQATRVAMIETGEAHAMLLGPSDVTRVEAMAGVTLDRVKSTRMDYLGFNLKKKPFDNVKVRQAISMAVNKDDVVNGVLDGQGIIAKGPLAPTVNGYSEDLTPLPYDVEAAKKLLAEAGYADGFKTTIWANEGSKERADIAELIQAQLAPLGIDVSIEIIEWGAFLEKSAAGEHEMLVLGWTTVTGDADYGLYAPYHSSAHGSAGNRSFYTNAKVDELLDKARQSTDQNERLGMYKEISQILIDEAPQVFLQHQDFVHATNGIASGFFADFSGTPYFKNVMLK
ncbi:glutathione ABC transporter substrate-binding protein [Bacillus sp. 31A1R]|uniref:Glutathione ABC transporter substrate-binding protein n=1 Tax=Robertmurraya mangrovi TaxID=3098077 RepID=A0ABU5J544_9BACI|nr:glutathione ABC transporter substrate-binding protein [Bacillus sp. 31A1R]MDZ5474546.1 glutathione ABC transporter substrate-binding protein [Bacillus sp. 31A1R]